jgi:iron complex transport system substrate-binding protein
VIKKLLVVALAGALLTGCSAEGGAEPEATSGAWSFTDDLGKTVSLDQRPARVAGLTDVLTSLWSYGIEPVAAFGFTAISADERFTGKDVSKVVEVGRTYGEINVEALAAAKPDVIVTHAYPVDSAGTLDPAKPLYGFKDVAQQEAVAKIAPIVTIAMKGTAVDVIKRTADLAVSLGVPADTGVIATSKADYDRAAAELTAAAKKGLRVEVVAAYPDEGLYVAKAKDDPALRMYTDLGVTFVDPGGTAYYWGTLSWENVGKLPADVVLYSKRAMSKDDMMKQATFARTPAAQAGQVYPWVFAGMDYVAMAAYMHELAGYLEGSRTVA